MHKWEYLTDLVTGDSHLDMKMTHWGHLGWELVAVLPKKHIGPAAIGGNPNDESWTLIFKKPAL